MTEQLSSRVRVVSTGIEVVMRECCGGGEEGGSSELPVSAPLAHRGVLRRHVVFGKGAKRGEPHFVVARLPAESPGVRRGWAVPRDGRVQLLQRADHLLPLVTSEQRVGGTNLSEQAIELLAGGGRETQAERMVVMGSRASNSTV